MVGGTMPARFPAALIVVLAVVTRPSPAPAAQPAAAATETVGQALCRLVETSAKARGLPVAFLTRLIWQESSFRSNTISPAGAQVHQPTPIAMRTMPQKSSRFLRPRRA